MTGHSLEELPPASKLVYKVIEIADKPLTHEDISEETMLSKRTTSDGLKKLQAADVVERRPDPVDARRYLYYISDA
jgi:DNA-binding transcriptional regulator GbsR (MarR family)